MLQEKKEIKKKKEKSRRKKMKGKKIEMSERQKKINILLAIFNKIPKYTCLLF